MDSIEYEDLHPTRIQGMYCDQCGNHLSLAYNDFAKVISGIKVTIRALPTLYCHSCRSTLLPHRSRLSVMHVYEEAKARNAGAVQVTRRKIKEEFGLTKIPFLYDPDDYYYLPGLAREWDRGYLAPVFFNRQVLIKFDHSEDYRLEFASRTYGLIRMSSNCISFGVNPNDKVVLWLGDIAKLPELEQYYLRSENVSSDHCLGSEFYDAQIECEFTQSTREDSIIKARSEFLEAASRYFGLRISHLDEETLDAIRDFHPPTALTRREKQRFTTLVNQICVESLDNPALGRLLEARQSDPKGLGGLKRLERLLGNEFPDAQVSSLLCAFFVAYDLRVAYAHLTSNDRRDELIRSACQRLELVDDARFEVIYEHLLMRLAEGYARLTDLMADQASLASNDH